MKDMQSNGASGPSSAALLSSIACEKKWAAHMKQAMTENALNVDKKGVMVINGDEEAKFLEEKLRSLFPENAFVGKIPEGVSVGEDFLKVRAAAIIGQLSFFISNV